MDLRFDFVLEPTWPALAWVAKCVRSESVIHVRHGRQVETRGSWFCEAVWDGEYAAGGFDQTDLVFGSGARLRDGRVMFVSSGATVDRLQHLTVGDTVWISNSLVCLLAVGSACPQMTYERYPEFFASLTRGIDGYERRLPTEHGTLELVYFHNLAWDGEKLLEEQKPFPIRSLGSFQEYRGFLADSLAAIARNMQVSDRSHRYEMIGGISSGYDSPTVAVLAREAGLERVFSFRTARWGEEDHGEAVASALGLELTMVDRAGWQRLALPELPYLAATGLGADVTFGSAGPLLRGRVFVSGFHGDRLWGKETRDTGQDIVRAEIAGLSFTEHRLELGCIHFPLPFAGARQIGDVIAISNSSEIAAWDVPGDYSRPICRRIVEEAGVPRGKFGIEKRAAAALLQKGEATLTESSRAAYYRWLAANRSRWTRRQLRRQMIGRGVLVLRGHYWRARDLLRRHAPRPSDGTPAVAVRRDMKLWRRLNRPVNLVAHLFPWAVESLGAVYRTDQPERESAGN